MGDLSEKQEETVQRIRGIYKKWFIHEPLMYAVMVYHKLVPNEEIKSIRVNSGRLEFNTGFIATLLDYKLNEVLMFEAYRVLLKHPYQRVKPNKVLNYYSSSITINRLFDHSLDVVALEDFGIGTGGHENGFHEYYYNLISDAGPGRAEELVDMPECSRSGGDGQGEDMPGSSEQDADAGETADSADESGASSEQADSSAEFGSSSPSDYEGEGELDFNPEEDSYLNSMPTAHENADEWRNQEEHIESINKCIEEAMKSKLWGSVSGSVKSAIITTLKPELDYRSILKKFKASIMGVAHNVPTTRKFNRRLGFPFPGRTMEPTTKIGFCLDVSGSISDEGLNKGFSLIKRLFSYEVGEIELIQFDVDVKKNLICKLQKAKLKYMVAGREGTDLRELFDYMTERKDLDNYLIFTDGYFDHNLTIPRNKNVCFLLESRESYEDFIQSKLAQDSLQVAYIKPSL